MKNTFNKMLKRNNINVAEDEYYNYVKTETFDNDVIINFYQVVPEGIVKQYTVVMSIVTAKLIEGVIIDAVRDFKEKIRSIDFYHSELYDQKQAINPLDRTLYYINNACIHFNEISFSMELFYEGPGRDINLKNLIIAPELMYSLQLDVNQIIKNYEESKGIINLEEIYSS